jgi:large subunit ribosomal protein L15
MVVQKRRKYLRKIGRRTCGNGSHKKNRNSGSRGGRGKAGRFKHKKTWVYTFEPDYIGGDKGFINPSKVKYRLKAITLRDIDVIAKKLGKKEIDVSELGFDKVVATGKLTQPLSITAKKIVDRAKEKIESSGGKAIENET